MNITIIHTFKPLNFILIIKIVLITNKTFKCNSYLTNIHKNSIIYYWLENTCFYILLILELVNKQIFFKYLLYFK